MSGSHNSSLPQNSPQTNLSFPFLTNPRRNTNPHLTPFLTLSFIPPTYVPLPLTTPNRIMPDDPNPSDPPSPTPTPTQTQTQTLFPHHLVSDSDSDNNNNNNVQEDDYEDDDDDEDDDDVPHPDSPSSSPDPRPLTPPPPPLPPPTLTLTVPPLQQRPIDDSRRLFQRLWTDEDEINLLQGFLDYTASRGSHHHDTTAFYEQIKDKLQLEFNKNQLVEKLRRLKKKYRNVLAKMSSGKDFVFKSNHDHATFQLSRQIWFNLSPLSRPTPPTAPAPAPAPAAGGGANAVEFDHDDAIPIPNPNPNPSYGHGVTIARPLNSSYVINHINLNSPTAGAGGFDMAMGKLSSRKRSRVGGKVEEKVLNTESGANINNNNNHVNHANNNVVSSNYLSNVGVSSSLQGLVEETVRNCLSPVLNNLVNTATNGGSASGPGFKGLGALNFTRGMDEKWRKQEILELEVYSKRLELVQDQIKVSLEELKAMES